MPDDRSNEIEKRIDRGITDLMPLSTNASGSLSIMPRSMSEVMEFAKLMSVSGFCVRPAFRGNPGACLGVSLQAFRCGGDPFAWANKAYITKNKSGDEQIAYEAQLLHAIVNSSPVLARRLRPVYEGEGQNRVCRVVGYIRGEDEPLEYESPPIGKIGVKNSPLWQSDPDQQLWYYATRAWARRHVPEILLGIYAPEEFTETIDLTPDPEPQRQDFIEQRRPEPEPEPEPQFAVIDMDGIVDPFHSAPRAYDAMRLVLREAARDSLARLEGCWESNEPLIEAFQASAPLNATELAAEYADLHQARVETDRRAEASKHPVEQSPLPSRSASSPGLAAGHHPGADAKLPADGSPQVEDAASRRGGDTLPNSPAAQPTRQEDANGLGGPAAAGDTASIVCTRAGGCGYGGCQEQNRCLAEDAQRRPPASKAPLPTKDASKPERAHSAPAPATGERAIPPTRAIPTASPGTAPESGGASSVSTAEAQASIPAGPGQIATSAASPSERPFPGDLPAGRGLPATAEELRGGSAPSDERKSVAIPIPMKQGKPDLRTWAVALFMPKLRRQRLSNDLADLLGDNAETLYACRAAAALDRDTLADLEQSIKDQWLLVENG